MYGCPYGACGRKFVSAYQLKEHIERRHAPNKNAAKKKPVTRVEKADDIVLIDTTSSKKKQEQPMVEIGTPIHPKMQNPIKKFEEDNKPQRPGTSGANMYFKAAPRPVTSHGRAALNQQT